MKRILMVSCEGLGNGGVQAVIMNIVRNLNDVYTFDALLFTNEKRHYDDEFLTYGGQIYRIPRYSGANRLRKKIDYYIRGRHLYKKVLRLFRENGPFDVVHCNDEFESAPIIKAAKVAGIPVRIVHTHVISQSQNFLANALNNYRRKVIDKYATVKIGCSLAACESFYKNPQSAFVVNNPFNNHRFDPKLYSISGEKNFQLIQIGSYSPNKNQLFSIRVVECIKRKYPDVKLILVGFSFQNYQDLLYKEINDKNLSKNVILLPSDADTPKLLSQAAGFLFPSIHEGFGIVLIEAQAMGTRCYASTNVPETTNCGGVTYLALEDGAEKWADTIIQDYEQTHGVHREYNISNFTIEKVIEKYRLLYEGK